MKTSLRLRSRTSRLAHLALALLLAATVHAGESAAPAATSDASARDPFALRLGAFLLSGIETSLSLTTASGGGGTLIDFGDTLGGDTTANVFRADAEWHISGPHRVEASWYNIDLTGHRALSKEIIWGGETYPIDAEIDSQFRTQIYKLSYGYTFKRGEKHEYFGMIGAHVISFDTSITAKNLGQTEGFSITAPLPAFGIGWTARWTDRFLTRAIVQYFGISIEDGKYSGNFTDGLLVAEFKLSKHWSIGGGYNRFDLDVDLKRDPVTLTVSNSYNGFLVYVAAYF